MMLQFVLKGENEKIQAGIFLSQLVVKQDIVATMSAQCMFVVRQSVCVSVCVCMCPSSLVQALTHVWMDGF